jgi:hypothetical protein
MPENLLQNLTSGAIFLWFCYEVPRLIVVQTDPHHTTAFRGWFAKKG